MPSVSSCHIDNVLQVIGDRWVLAIIHELSTGPRRTLELLASFTGLSTKTLADRLKKLEHHNLVDRISYRESPPRVEYSLTEKGQSVLPVLNAMRETAGTWPENSMTVSTGRCRACEATNKHALPHRIQPNRKRQTRGRTDVTLL